MRRERKTHNQIIHIDERYIASHRIHTKLFTQCFAPDAAQRQTVFIFIEYVALYVIRNKRSVTQIAFNSVGLLASNVRQVCVVVETTNEVCARELIGGRADM